MQRSGKRHGTQSNLTKEVLCTREGNGWDFKADAAQILGSGNSQGGERFGVKKLHWLSKPTAKLEGSLVVYVDSWTAAQQILSKKEFKVGPSLAGARTFVQQQQPVRCYNCNRYGHTQSRCHNPARCANCAGPHQTMDCTGKHPDKCASCLGAHKVTDARFPHYRKEKERIANDMRQQGGHPVHPLCQ